jgi:heme exporter protein A
MPFIYFGAVGECMDTQSPASDRVAVRMLGVRRRYGTHDALRGVDLSITTGSAVAALGANGAGKTTLLRVLAGLLRPTDGEIEIFGIHLPADSALRARIGVVAHESFLYPDLTALENLRFYARLYGVDEPERPVRSLASVGLEASASRAVRTFSRGMVQRLAMARAMLHEPELLILDEPFSALDPAASDAVERSLLEARDSGVTIVFSTHDLEGALRLASRVIILERGMIAWDSAERLPTVAHVREMFASVSVHG